MKVEYSSNNSGGGWWLKDKDWLALEKAGWTVHWAKEHEYKKKHLDRDKERWLGALATEASKDFPSVTDAIREFERITGQQASDKGCNCCGPPHSFRWNDGESHWASGDDVLEYLFPGKHAGLTKREMLEREP